MKKFKKVSYTIDEKIAGNEGSPFTVEIISNSLFQFKREYNKSVSQHLKNFTDENFWKKLPINIEGKLLKRKKPIDVMKTTPHFLGLKIIISEMIKNVLEELKVDSKEYFLREIQFNKSAGNRFYLFFASMIDADEIIFEKSTFYKNFIEDGILKKIRKSYKDKSDFFLDASSFYSIEKCYLRSKFENYDIINLQAGGLYFSERLINSIKNSGAIGLDVSEDIEIICDEPGSVPNAPSSNE